MVVTVGLEPTVSLCFACSVRFAIVVIPPWSGGFTPLLTTLPPRFIRRWRSSVDECQRRKFSAKNPEDMLKLGSVASMGLPKYLLKLLTKANWDLLGGKTMDKEWERLYEEAMSVLNPHDVSNKMWVGSVASAVLTKKGNIYKGICIDTDGSIGMCAERNALSTMLTYGESEITKVVSVYKDGNIIPSCGICREFMMHLGGDVENIEILLDKEGRTERLIELMPEYPRHK